MERYYCILRPAGPGAIPAEAGDYKVHNFDTRTFCEEIGREAWGYIECENNIKPEVLKQYDMISAKAKTWWCVTTSVNLETSDVVKSAVTETRESVEQPEDWAKTTSHIELHKNWFESKEKAEAWIKEIYGETEDISTNVNPDEQIKKETITTIRHKTPKL